MYGSYYSPNRFKHYQPTNFPQDIECIIKSSHPTKGSLYISNIEAAQNQQTLKKFNIRAVLSCAKGYSVNHPQHVIQHYKYIPMEDRQSYDLTPHFDQCVDFIDDTLQKTNILVHCIAGVSRSVSMVIAYLMAVEGMKYQEAHRFVKSQRKIISPNSGFISQLKRYQQKLKKLGNKAKKQSSRSKTPPTYQPNNFSRSNTTLTPKKSVNQFERTNTYLYTPNYKRVQHFKQENTANTRNYQNIQDIKTPIKLKLQKNKDNDNYQHRHGFTIDRNIDRQGYFDSMNNELNQKIQAIKDKYQKQRQQLMNRNKNVYSYHERENTRFKSVKQIPVASQYQQERYKKYRNDIKNNLEIGRYHPKDYLENKNKTFTNYQRYSYRPSYFY